MNPFPSIEKFIGFFGALLLLVGNTVLPAYSEEDPLELQMKASNCFVNKQFDGALTYYFRSMAGFEAEARRIYAQDRTAQPLPTTTPERLASVLYPLINDCR